MARMSVDLPAPERPDDDDHLAVGDLERQAAQGMDAPGYVTEASSKRIVGIGRPASRSEPDGPAPPGFGRRSLLAAVARAASTAWRTISSASRFGSVKAVIS